MAVEEKQDFFSLSPSQLLSELRGATMLGVSGAKRWAANQWSEDTFAPKEGDKEAIVLVQGFGATHHAYYEVAHRLHLATGLGVVFLKVAPNALNLNLGSIGSMIGILLWELKRLASLGIERIFWVGHSLGGIQGCLVKRSMNFELEIAHVFAVASPVNDTP